MAFVISSIRIRDVNEKFGLGFRAQRSSNSVEAAEAAEAGSGNNS